MIALLVIALVVIILASVVRNQRKITRMNFEAQYEEQEETGMPQRVKARRGSRMDFEAQYEEQEEI